MSSFLSLACINIERTEHLDRVLAFLQKAKPDVVCLQEVYEYDLQKFAEKLGMESAFGQMMLMGRDNKLEPPFLPFGIALLSRLPMSNLRRSYYHGDEESVQNLLFDGNYQSYYHLVLSATFQKDEKKFTIGTTHFTWTPDGKADDVQRGERPPPHRVDVAERVRHGNLAECVRIVHDRGEEIDGLDDRQIVTETIDPCVLRMLHPHDKIRIGDERQIFKRFVQVARTYLTGSPRPVDRFGETHFLTFYQTNFSIIKPHQ